MSDERAPLGWRVVAREAAIVVFLLVITLVATWPLARHLDSAVADPGDPYINAWILDWLYHAAISGKPIFDASIFYPAPLTLTFSENLIGIAVVMVPLRMFVSDPLTMHNLALILGIALSGYGATLLGRAATGSFTGAMAGGLFFTLVPWRFTHLVHLQHQWCFWLALMLGALLLYARRPSRPLAALFGFAVLMNGLSNLHWFAFGTFSAGLVALVLSFRERRYASWRYWSGLAAATLIALACLLPALLPYRQAKQLFGLRGDPSETLRYSAALTDWLIADPASRYGSLTNNGSVDPERWLFPGLAILLLSALSVWPIAFASRSTMSKQKRWGIQLLDGLIAISACATILGAGAIRHLYWAIGEVVIVDMNSARNALRILIALVIVRIALTLRKSPDTSTIVFRDALLAGAALVAVGVAGSLGLRGAFFRFLFDHVELFAGIRAPARWSMLAYLGLVVLAACGVARIIRFSRDRTAFATVSILFLFLAFDLRRGATRYFLHDGFERPVDTWLARSAFSGGVLELPMDQTFAYGYMLDATRHHKPIVNGVSGYIPPHHERLAAMTAAGSIPNDTLDVIHGFGVEVMIVHADFLGDDSSATRAWIRRELEAKRLRFIGRFDSYAEGDFVFALSDAKVTAPSLGRDGAGRTREEELQRFLAGSGRAWNGRTFGAMDYPAHGAIVKGPLRVSGWALSPHGVKEVNLLFGNHRLRVPAASAPYDELRSMFPWYGSERPMFHAELARRPEGLDAETDVQVEIVDGRGERTRLVDVWFRWE